MTFADLPSVARQWSPQDDPRNDPVRLPPDPQIFGPLGPTNPAPMQLASLEPPQGRPDQPPLPEPPDEDTDLQPDGKGWWRDTSHDGSNYFPPAPAKGYNDWGKRPLVDDMDSSLNESPGPFVPSMEQSWGVINGAGRNLSRWSAPSVAGPAGSAAMLAGAFAPLLDIVSAGAFGRKYNEAQMKRQQFELQKQLMTLRIQQEQMVQQSELAVQRHDQMMLDFSKIFFEYDQGVISEEEARHRVRALAKTKYMHDNLNEMLEAKGLKGVEDYLNNEHAYITALAGGAAAQRKAMGGETSDSILESYGEKTSTKKKGLLDFPNLPGRGGEPAPSIPDVTPAPKALPKTAEEYGDALSKEMGLTGRELETAMSLARGTEPPGYNDLKNPKSPEVAALAAKIHKAADRIRSDEIRAATDQDPTLSPEQKLQNLDKIDPIYATTLRSLSRYGTDPDKLTGIKNREELLGVLSKINPNWREGGYKIIQKYHEVGPSNTAGRVLESIGGFNTAMYGLVQALDTIPEDRKRLYAEVVKWYNNLAGGDPTYAQLFTAIQNVVAETTTIAQKGYRPSVEIQRDRVKQMASTMSPAQIRASLYEDALAAYGVGLDFRNQFRAEIGDPTAQVPFFPKNVQDEYEAILRMNRYTGEFPSDAPPQYLAYSKKPGKDRPSWLKKGGEWDYRPLTKEEVDRGRTKLRNPDLVNSPDQEVQKYLQNIRRALGVFANPAAD